MKRILFIVISTIFCTNVFAQIITTVAGGGNCGSLFCGDGGQATNAAINYTNDVAFDKIGNFYLADYDNHSIRKVSTTGIISTIAGNGYPADTGDGGLAINASLYNPLSVAVDAAGNIYCSSGGTYIRKVNTDGIISTVAGSYTYASYGGDGGQATAAKLNNPAGIAFDLLGNLYFADSENNRVRMINTAGVITTVVGTGTQGYSGDGGQATLAQLYDAYGVAIDSSGNLYVADCGNHRIRMINKMGIISTIAGTGIAGFSGDSGPATNAKLNGPCALTFDASGNLYITDMNNNRIRKINNAGIIQTIAGSGSAGFSGDGGQATSATFNHPGGLACNYFGDLYIADFNNSRVRMITCSKPILASSNITFCEGATYTPINVSGTGIVLWSTSSTMNPIINTGSSYTPSALPLGTTTYYLVDSVSGCINPNLDSVSVSVVTDSLPNVKMQLVQDSIPHVWDLYIYYSNNVTNATWYWGDGTDTTSLYPYHLYDTAGVYTICITVFNACGDSSSFCLSDSIYRLAYNATSASMVRINVLQGDQTTGIESESKKSLISIYPNPSSNHVTVQSVSELGIITVYNSLSEIILQIKSTAMQEQIDISKFAPGIYIIQAQNSFIKLIKE